MTPALALLLPVLALVAPSPGSSPSPSPSPSPSSPAPSTSPSGSPVPVLAAVGLQAVPDPAAATVLPGGTATFAVTVWSTDAGTVATLTATPPGVTWPGCPPQPKGTPGSVCQVTTPATPGQPVTLLARLPVAASAQPGSPAQLDVQAGGVNVAPATAAAAETVATPPQPTPTPFPAFTSQPAGVLPAAGLTAGVPAAVSPPALAGKPSESAPRGAAVFPTVTPLPAPASSPVAGAGVTAARPAVAGAGSPLGWQIAGSGLLAAGGGLGALQYRRRRRKPGDDGPGDDQADPGSPDTLWEVV